MVSEPEESIESKKGLDKKWMKIFDYIRDKYATACNITEDEINSLFGPGLNSTINDANGLKTIHFARRAEYKVIENEVTFWYVMVLKKIFEVLPTTPPKVTGKVEKCIVMCFEKNSKTGEGRRMVYETKKSVNEFMLKKIAKFNASGRGNEIDDSL